MDKKQRLVCPSCGTPVRRFQVSEKVKIALVLFVIGYFVLSLLVLAVVSPNGLRKACRYYDYIHQPDYCKETEFKASVRPLNDDPLLQALVSGGLAAGVLLFYWDWFQNRYADWRRKQGETVEEGKKTRRHKCPNCGRQWD